MSKYIDIIREYTQEKGPPLDPVFLANKLGLAVQFELMDENISGVLEKQNDGKFHIKVNSRHHPNRQRFTIAHEIGHFILHNHLIGNGIQDNKAFEQMILINIILPLIQNMKLKQINLRLQF